MFTNKEHRLIHYTNVLDSVSLGTGDVTTVEILDGTIVNADVDAAAAIAGTKITSASVTVVGTVELATGAETNTGTDATRAVTPDGLDDWTGSAQVTTVGIVATGTIATRVNPRVSTETSSATPTINTDNVDAHSITALALAVTSMTTNLSGTPVNFEKLTIRFLDDGTGRAITWGASFQAMGVALPTTTTASKVLTVGFIFDSVDSKWGCVAVSEEA